MEKEKQMLQMYSTELNFVNEEAKNTYSFTFSKPDHLNWTEGASIHLADSRIDKNLGKATKEFARHLSIVSLPEENCLKFTTRIPELRSDFKDCLKKAKPGDQYKLFKLDNKMALKREGKRIILISAGVSTATMRPLIKRYVENPTQINGLNHIHIDSSGEYLFRDELENYQKSSKGFSNHFTDSRDRFCQVLENSIDMDAIYYIVGSDAFIISISKRLMEKGIDVQSINLDKKKPFYDKLTS